MHPDILDEYHGSGARMNKGLFFIVGQARSGTSWFARFMTTKNTFCFHELSIACHGGELFKETGQRRKYVKIGRGERECRVWHGDRCLKHLFDKLRIFGR